MLLALVCSLLAASRTTSASDLQVPMLTVCPESHNVTVFDVTATSQPGSNMLNVSFHIDVIVSLKTYPTLEVAMTEEGMESLIPCVEDVGSCLYHLCDGNSTMEMELTKAWSNTCPIPPGKYFVNMTLDLMKNKYLTSGNANKIFKYMFEDGGNVTGCVSFPVYIPTTAGSSAMALPTLHALWMLTISLFSLRFW
ncbi:uncharacterized protein [Dermacentor andersoni]|uniref:uncharacterized protein n=1 Tax=Dermacentor andersoni TaxID=34620 RepID=UPI002155BB55|nr:uncharacterized protein LOC126544776 [Dermacentor andersoni]